MGLNLLGRGPGIMTAHPSLTFDPMITGGYGSQIDGGEYQGQGLNGS